jgi:hypothetical protein
LGEYFTKLEVALVKCGKYDDFELGPGNLGYNATVTKYRNCYSRSRFETAFDGADIFMFVKQKEVKLRSPGDKESFFWYYKLVMKR